MNIINDAMITNHTKNVNINKVRGCVTLRLTQAILDPGTSDRGLGAASHVAFQPDEGEPAMRGRTPGAGSL